MCKLFPGFKNSAKEKEKLANMMAFGKDIDPAAERSKYRSQPVEYEEETELDRFDECKNFDKIILLGKRHCIFWCF